MNSTETQVALNKQSIDENKKDIVKLDDEKVGVKDFNPVKGIVYGLVTIILTAVIYALLGGVIK